MLSATNDEILLNYCSNIGQLQIDKADIQKAEKCVEDVITALKNKSGTSLLKACTQLKSKQTETVDCLLFFRVFQKKLYGACKDDLFKSISIYHISRCMQELSRNTINKKSSIECMLINILEDIKNAEIS